MGTASRLTVLTLLLTTACAGDAPAPPEQTEPSAPTASTSALAPTSLEGEWRVAGIDGEEVNEPYAIALSADGREIWWEPRCAGMLRRYTIDGNAFTAGPHTNIPPAAGSLPPPVCAIALPPRLNDVVRALDTADRVERTLANGILIEGGGHSVLLFSQ